MRSHRTVSDVMTRNLISVDPSRSFKDIAHLLSAKGISAVPVLDNIGRPLGVVSESDLILKEEFQAPPLPGRLSRRLRTVRARAAARTAEQLMSVPAVIVGQNDSLPDAARLMASRHITRLIVVDAQGLSVGIVTRSDLLQVDVVNELRYTVDDTVPLRGTSRSALSD